ncbi:transposase [Micromonospora saelicesensis]|uniref:transposase n=1 Tax=Micromonospora saelicesensis TaxID=285676 RepID=UPI003CF100A9
MPGLTRRYARHTVLAAGDLQAVAVALGGRPGTRLAHRVAVSVSRMTLIRMIRRMPDPPPVTPTVLGVDDFARRRGHRYATVLLDMQTRRPIDVLPDRTADTLAAWLREHPGVQIICRDRGGSYADGARKGAPDAVQVADRWHLLKNLSDTIEKVVRGHRRCLREHTDPISALSAPVTTEPGPTGRRAANTRQRQAAVHALRAEGLSISATARRLDMNVRTARKYAHAATAEALIGPNASSRPSVLAPFHPHLRQRLTDGIHETVALHAEILARGYQVSLRVLKDWLTTNRTRPTPVTVRVPSARRITAWIMRPGHKLTDVRHRHRHRQLPQPDQDRLRRRDKPPPHHLPSHRVHTAGHDRPRVHVQTNTRTLTEHRGLPQMSALPTGPTPRRQSTPGCE